MVSRLSLIASLFCTRLLPTPGAGDIEGDEAAFLLENFPNEFAAGLTSKN